MNISGLPQVFAWGALLSDTVANVATGAKPLTIKAGQSILTKVKANASGRPGPRAPTGDYRRSWNMQNGGGALTPWVEVGTNAAQGRRLEFGFVGTDALGRDYNQPPYPHAGPAADAVIPEYTAALLALGLPGGRIIGGLG